MAVEPLPFALQEGGECGIVEVDRARRADVAQLLRYGGENTADLAQWFARAGHHREHLQAGEQTVAGGGVVGEHDVARLLAAQIVPAGAHGLDHIAVTYARTFERKAEAREEALEPEIGHDSRDHPGARKAPSRCHSRAIMARI